MSLRANEVAQAAGVNRATLRYYERRGLLGEPERSLGGHRLYDDGAVSTLRMIKSAQRLGFSLTEIAELIEVRRRASSQRRGQDRGLQAHARAKLLEIEARLTDLAEIRDQLTGAIAAGCDDVDECTTSDSCPLGVGATVTDDARGGALTGTRLQR